MNTKTKMLVVKGDANCGKTTILKKLSQYLQDELEYILLSHNARGNPDKDICDLLQNGNRKLPTMSSPMPSMIFFLLLSAIITCFKGFRAVLLLCRLPINVQCRRMRVVHAA